MSQVPQPYDPYKSDPYPQSASAYGQPVRRVPDVRRLQYLYAYQFLFESGNWFLNLVMGSLAWLSAQVIPIIGPLVYMGYQYEILDHLHRNRTLPYPDFDFNRFGDYLARGAPPFVVGLIFFLLLMPLMFICYVGGFLILPLVLHLMDQADAPEALMGIVAIAVLLMLTALFFLLIAVVSLLTGPMALRAGLSGNIGEGFNFGFAIDFIKRTWWDMLLAYLWLTVTGVLLYCVGLMFLCIGAYPAMVWTHLAATHMNWQLYELYLERGGEPIPLKKVA